MTRYTIHVAHALLLCLAAMPPPVVVAAVAPPVAFLPPAPVLQMVVAQSSAPSAAGISMKTVWDFEVTDAALIPREFLTVNESRIRERVTALKGAAIIPGVRVFSRQVVAAKGR